MPQRNRSPGGGGPEGGAPRPRAIAAQSTVEGLSCGPSFPSLRATLVHLCGAEWVWHSRWRGRSPASIQSLLAESESPLDQLESICHFWSRLQQQIVAFVRELGDEGITRTFSYTLFSGASFSSPYWQTVQHLVNHGSYHRGQVTNMLRQLGAAPAPPTDLIAYYREVRG